MLRTSRYQLLAVPGECDWYLLASSADYIIGKEGSLWIRVFLWGDVVFD